jgi:3-hydroxybutyryl-CoA dehydrogenase
MKINKETMVGVLGAGTMGSGIAQVAAGFGHKVILVDSDYEALGRSEEKLAKVMKRLVEKGKISEDESSDLQSRIERTTSLPRFRECGFVIEAIIENLDIKKQIFSKMEDFVKNDTVIATNTSSLSIASISSAFRHPERFLGVHFFNPVPLMPLVEVVPSFVTDGEIEENVYNLIKDWGKVPVLAKDTPGFIVNRVARPFYSEALRLLEEGVADVGTIDWAMKEIGGFRMGPFELMDYIGHDVNYVVTETVFKQFYYDPRFKPSITQLRLLEAGLLGRKSGRGFYDYSENAEEIIPFDDLELGTQIFGRILSMLINEACDAILMGVAAPEDIELAMTKGVNYPKGLLSWCDEIGAEIILDTLKKLQSEYGEDRYRPNVLLKRMVRDGERFFD